MVLSNLKLYTSVGRYGWLLLESRKTDILLRHLLIHANQGNYMKGTVRKGAAISVHIGLERERDQLESCSKE